MGFFFLLLGGGGVFANWRRNWKLLSLIFLIGVILTVALMVTAMSAIMMASGSMDPVSEAVDLAWHDETVNFRKELETAHVETGEDERLTYCKDRTPITGVCSELYVAIDAKDDSNEGCEGPAAMFAFNCTAAANCTSTFDTPVGMQTEQLGLMCHNCDMECQETFTDEVKTGLEPATYVGVGTCFACLVTFLWNQYMLQDDWEDDSKTIDSILGKLGMAWNGLVTFMGFVCFIVAIVGWGVMREHCPEGFEENCSGKAFLGAAIVALFLFLTGGAAMFGIWKDEGLTLRFANLCLFLLMISMIIATTIMGFSSGFVPSVQELYDDPTMSQEIHHVLSDERIELCHCNVELRTECDDSVLVDAALCDDSVPEPDRPLSCESRYCGCGEEEDFVEDKLLTLAQCKGRLQVLTLKHMKVIGIVTMIMVVVAIGVNVLTLLAVTSYRQDAADKGEEEWDVTAGDGEESDDK
eukprot:COSAG04_NODE_1179_length_7905_cov_12.347041_2_plen_468_part_00